MKDRIFLVHLNLIFFRIRLYSKIGLNEGLPRHIWVRKQQGKKGWVNMKRRLLFLVRLRTHSMRLSSSCPLSPGGFQFVTVLAILFSFDTLFVKSHCHIPWHVCIYISFYYDCKKAKYLKQRILKGIGNVSNWWFILTLTSQQAFYHFLMCWIGNVTNLLVLLLILKKYH